MKPLHRIRVFLMDYAPWLLPLARFLLHTVRFSFFKVQGQLPISSDAYAQYLQNIVDTSKNCQPNDRPPHILLYTGSLSSGGAERQWCYLANELACRGYTVTLLAEWLEGTAGHYAPLVSSGVRLLGGDSMNVPVEIVDKAIASLPYPVCLPAMAFFYLQPTHVLCQLDHTNIIGSTAALLVNAGQILMSFRSVNPSHFPYIHAEWMRPHYKTLIASSRIVLTGNSKAGNDDYAGWLGVDKSTITTIHNAVKIPDEKLMLQRETLRSQLGIEDDRPVILGVFRFTREKNFGLFLDVIRTVRQRIPNLLVLHAGEGPEAKEVQCNIQRYKLQDTVRFLGPRSDVENLMHCADLLLLTSDNEGLPNVVLEAQAASLPVVATRVGGIPEAVREGATGLLAPKGDRDTLVEHCVALLQNPDLRQSMGNAGRQFIQQYFSHAALGDKVLDLIGLPRTVTQPAKLDLQPVHKGLTIPRALALNFLQKYFEHHLDPVVCFTSDLAMKPGNPLPKGSLWICSTNMASDDNDVIAFDWQSATDWTPLQKRISQMPTAVFLDGTCCIPAVRSGLKQCGFEQILFHDQGNLYLMPTIHPSLLRRLLMLTRSTIRNAWRPDGSRS